MVTQQLLVSYHLLDVGYMDMQWNVGGRCERVRRELQRSGQSARKWCSTYTTGRTGLRHHKINFVIKVFESDWGFDGETMYHHLYE